MDNHVLRQKQKHKNNERQKTFCQFTNWKCQTLSRQSLSKVCFSFWEYAKSFASASFFLYFFSDIPFVKSKTITKAFFALRASHESKHNFCVRSFPFIHNSTKIEIHIENSIWIQTRTNPFLISLVVYEFQLSSFWSLFSRLRQHYVRSTTDRILDIWW